MKNLLLLLCLASILFAPLQALSMESSNKELHDQINLLEERIHNAAEEHALWRDTDKLLSQAKEQLAKNNPHKTQELIDKIEFQLKQSLEQSRNQSDISTLVPHYLMH